MIVQGSPCVKVGHCQAFISKPRLAPPVGAFCFSAPLRIQYHRKIMTRGRFVFKHFLYPAVGMALLGLAVHAFAADKNPCPPIVPKTDMAYMKKIQAAMALTNDAAKRAAIKKLQDIYSRDITKPETWSG